MAIIEAIQALNRLCEECHKHIQSLSSKGSLPHKECPWRHISNDYCEDYEIIKTELLKIGEQ